MDLYTSSLVVGVAGLTVMGFSGIGRHSRSAAHGHASGHGGHAHAGHGSAHGHGHTASGHAHHGPHASKGGGGGSVLSVLLASPRILFSLLIGFGATGVGLK